MIAIRRSRELRYEGLRERVRDVEADLGSERSAPYRHHLQILDTQVIDLVGK